MAATFDANLDRPLDLARFIVGDTNVAQAEVEDETYTALLAANGADVNLAALAVADYLILLYARQPDSVEITGAVKVAFQSRIAALEQIAARLRIITGAPGAASAFIQAGVPTFGGDFLKPWEPLRLGPVGRVGG